jgi:ABC-2 type transport system ATP-binding protein
MNAAIAVESVSRNFGSVRALDGVSLDVQHGQIRALLGPNGAGKTTLLRILIGLVTPDAGQVRLAGADAADRTRRTQLIGFVPSGDRSFYLRVSGLENLVFFGRLHGLTRRVALARARDRLEEVGLADVGRARVNTYSHGMHKRLSLARALIMNPEILLVDEATHDLDPEGGHRVRALVRDLAAGGTAVLWTTQRLEEIRLFADFVTLLAGGRVRFSGTVPQLLQHVRPTRHIISVAVGNGPTAPDHVNAILGDTARVHAIAAEDAELVLELSPDATLGEAIAILAAGGLTVLACRAEQSEVEQAFFALTRP